MYKQEDIEARSALLNSLWEGINSYMAERWIDFQIRESAKNPNGPFADSGPALARLLEIGASRRDISLVCRHAAYDSSFQTLYDVCDSSLSADVFAGIYEELLGHEPTGMDARPGSAPPPKNPIESGTP